MLESSLGPAQHHEGLTIFPILAEHDRELPYLLMAEALATGVLTIREIGQGQVPMLEAQNRALDPVLILDGEQLIGAKQNRMTNRSIVLPPETVTKIPVSCMEQGRWRFTSGSFEAAPQHSPSSVRRKARETEARSARRARDAEARGASAPSSYRDLAAAQGEVWGGIQELSASMGSHSETGALDSVYEGRRKAMESWIGAFPRLPHQIGLMAFLGGVPLGLDALGSRALFEPLHRRILTGYVLDAMEGRGRGSGQPGEPDPSRFLEASRTARRTPSESVGVGEYRILDGSALGGELVDDGHLVHLSAFPPLEGVGPGNGLAGDGQSIPIARPSQRRRSF
jgi:hypothetical protein